VIVPQTSQQYTHAAARDPREAPEALKQQHKCMGTKLEPRSDGKLNKPPYRVRAGLPVIKADKTNPENWATFEEAYDALRRGDVDAIGFVFTEDDPFTVIDLDGAVNPETGEIDARATAIVDEFPTYWEFSLSGRGLHGICIAKKPGTRCRTGNIEIYDGHSGARFIVITGNRLGAHTDIRECQESVNDLYYSLFGKVNKEKQRPRPRTHDLPKLEELLEKARNFTRMGAKFRKLFDRADISEYESASDADYALINMLIFLCAGDREMVIEAFKKSALYRPPPQKHRRYVELSVDNALSTYTGGFYEPKAVRDHPEPEQEDILTPYLALLAEPSQWKGPKAPGAYKAYAALILLTVEDGISDNTKELRIGTDMRRWAEVAGLTRQTLGNSSLPHLVQDLKLVRWEKGRGGKPGVFVLPRPAVPVGLSSKESTGGGYFTGKTYGDGLVTLAKLIRMRTGTSKTGKVRHLGEMQKVARLGMLCMFCMIASITSPRGLNIDELVDRTGRRKDHVRNACQKLVASEIFEESRKDFFTLAPAFWSAYDKELLKSGIVAAERRQKRQHEQERRDDRLRLEARREGRKVQKPDPKVVDLDARRREKLDREAARRQFIEGQGQVDERFLTEEQQHALMQEEYDRMCARVQQRLAHREDKRRGEEQVVR
jgi:hypothetical protein